MKAVVADTITDEETGEAIGTEDIGLTILMPHIIFVILGTIFNAVAWIGKQHWAALTAAILYATGGVLGLVNYIFVLISMVLCFVVYGKTKNDYLAEYRNEQYGR